jgi:hypothetical protein
MENSSLELRIPEYRSETIVITRVGSTIDVSSLAVGASAGSRTGPSRPALTLLPGNSRTSDESRGHIISSCWPVRKGRTKKIGDKHKGEGERCAENLVHWHT